MIEKQEEKNKIDSEIAEFEKKELEKIKEILPDYIHKISKTPPPLTDSLNYLLKEE